MKFKIPLIIALFVFATSAYATQHKAPPMPDLSPVFEQMSLDSDQAEKLTTLVKAHHQQMRAQHNEKSELREAMRSIREAHRDELLSVLSYEQLYQFEQYMRQFKRGHKNEKFEK
ncbi:MAG: hypothetical protein ACI845_003820 [Gammaproteobacteria bacterium]|jgi:hypothetical protein